jgi:CRISPR-associated exonuclease Cas4
VTYSDDELLPISALQHLAFCERQCALIHVERLWAENQLTVEGNLLHKKAHEASHETIRGVRVVRGLWLVSRSLGLIGQADIVEFHTNGLVLPVEYKRGKPKKNSSDRIQLCAQSLCLEEQLSVSIETANLFYGQKKRRTEVKIDAGLRELTIAAIKRLRQMIEFAETPPAVRLPKCEKCSLIELCLPDGNRFRTGASAWNERQYEAVLNSDGPESDEYHFVDEGDA